MKEDETINATIVESEADDRKSVMFGWCMDGHDEECIKEFPGHKCRCECHRSDIVDTYEQAADSSRESL